MNTYQRVREHGTVDTMPGNGEDRIAAIRQIVAEKQYAKVDGVMVDLFSASAIVKVYDALSADNQAKYRAMNAPKMATVAFKLIA